jgi:CheY-like chemotaxis protein
MDPPKMPRVLIVDDEPAIRKLLSLAFVRAGYDVRTAADPYKAIEACVSESFDAILSDVQMPGMDGHALVRWVASA